MDMSEIDNEKAPDPVLGSKTGSAALLRTLEGDAMFDGSVALALGSDYVLCHDLLDSFPLTAAQYVESTHNKFIPRLAAYVHFTLSEILNEEWLARAQDLRLATIAGSILHTLAHANFPEVEEGVDGVEGDAGSDLGLTVNLILKQTRAEKKRARTDVTIDPKLFQKAGFPVPRSRAQADELAINILEDVKELLSNYLDVLQQPETSAKIANALGHADAVVSGASMTSEVSHLRPQPIHSEPPISPNESSPSTATLTVNHQLRAMLESGIPRELGDWHILLSTKAFRDIKNAHRADKSRYRIIVAKIQQLSQGHFSPDNQKRLSKTASSIPIYEAKMTRDSRLVYRIDCITDPKYPNTERQAIKLFGVYTHAQMDDRLRCVFDAVGKEAARKGQAYKERCVYRESPVHSGDNVIPPATFYGSSGSLGARDDADVSQEHVSQLPPEDAVRVHSLLNLEKYMLFSRPVLNCIIADIDAAHVFNLSEKELEIIDHTGSCYVLGRSGTGKTTTMLFKMWGRERAQVIGGQELSVRARQLFVTQSHVLVEKVEEAYHNLAASLKAEVSSKDELMEWKAQRHGAVRDTFVAYDDRQEQGVGLPEKFSELQDEHFPLFLTFDKLCRLLERDAFGSAEEVPFGTRTTGAHVTRSSGELVTYERFLAAYWPHLSQKLVKGLDPTLVFSEILGVIKGSEATAKSTRHCLDRETYEKLIPKGQSTFAYCRSVIYDIYEQYTKMRISRRDFDAADRAHDILHAVREHGVKGRNIDYIYVDEVQDNMLIDTLVLRHITCNANGLFWGGDTAQTISVGSTFRFNELKSCLYKLEEKADAASKQEPPVFQLTTNYRSHAGIVDCAQTVIELLTEFWPDSIDVLSREEAEVEGAKPVFLTDWREDTIRFEQSLFTASTGQTIDLGAKQCILVRHEQAREQLIEKLGDIGVIMTIFDSKGLEFDDVFIFNFFQDSRVGASQWRVIFNTKDADGRMVKLPAPMFDAKVHAGVRSELKCLYVAITRARKNVWIVDNSDRSEPMRLLWTSRDQVQNCTPDNAPYLAINSTPEEWQETADELFSLEHYAQARTCYWRAGLPVQAEICRAHYLRQQAKVKPFSGFKNALLERHLAFKMAADAFMGCASTAANAGQAERGSVYYRAAANAYLAGDDKEQAAAAFVKAGDFTNGAQLYREVGNFDETINVVRTYRSHIPRAIADKLIDVSRLYYFQAKEFKKATDLFESTDKALEFLEDTPFDVEKAFLLESAGKVCEAAELYRDDRPLHAAHLFLQDVGSERSVNRARDCLLDGMWKVFAYGARIEDIKSGSPVATYLKLSTDFLTSDPDSAQSREFRMFHALAGKRSLDLRSLSRDFLQNGDDAAAFKCMQGVFHPQFPEIQDRHEEDVIDLLLLYKEYVGRLHEFALDPAPCDNANLCRILGLQRVETGRLCVASAGSFVHETVMSRAPEGARYTDGGVTIPTPYLTKLLAEHLRDMLHTSLLDASRCCQDAPAFRTVCLTFTLRGNCKWGDNCARTHPRLSSLDSRWFNRQIYLQLLIISILDYDVRDPGDSERLKYQRYWMHKLYESLFPPDSKLGAVIALSKKLVPEAQKHLQQVKYWCQDLLKADAAAQALRMVLRIAHLSFTFDRSDAQRYLTDVPALESLRQQPIFFRNGHYIVDQVLTAMKGEGTNFISDGVSFVRQVVDRRLSIDISALCDLCEYLAGCFVLARSPTGLHGLTLPKSWIPALVSRYKPRQFSPSTDALSAFMDGLAVLMDVLYGGGPSARYLRFEGSVVPDGTVVRGVYIGRICRMLCAIGYNQSKYLDERDCREGARERIMTAFGTWHGTNSIFDKYRQARSWDNLKKVFEESANDQLMDELVTLRFERSPVRVPLQAAGRIRQVSYKIATDIPSILCHDFFVVSSLRGDAPAFVPAALQARVEGQASPGIAIDHDDSADAQASGESELPAEVSDRQNADSFCPPPTPAQRVVAYRLLTAYRRRNRRRALLSVEALNAEFRPVPQHEQSSPSSRCSNMPAEDGAAATPSRSTSALTREQAVRVIEKAYRRLMTLRALAGLDRVRQRLYETCVAQADGLVFPSRRAKILYFGALPHILTCLDAVAGYLETAKVKIKEGFATLKHQRLEAMSERLVDINAAVKRTKSASDALWPLAATYSSEKCIELLEEHTKEVVALVECLDSEGQRRALEYDYEMAVSSVLEYEGREREKREKEARKQKEKPQLNTADDYYDEHGELDL